MGYRSPWPGATVTPTPCSAARMMYVTDVELPNVESLCHAYRIASDELSAAKRVANRLALVSWIAALGRWREVKGSKASHEAAEQKYNLACQELARHAVGADTTWGILSGDEKHNVEIALYVAWRRLSVHTQDAPLACEAERLRFTAGEARVLAHRGDASARQAFALRVARLVDRIAAYEREHPSFWSALDVGDGSLEFYLPVTLRQSTTDLEVVTRRNRPVKLDVSPEPGLLYLELIQNWDLPQKGAGSAALQDLCVLADRRGLLLKGKFAPYFYAEGSLDLHPPEECIARAARWYQRFGFRPDNWSGEWIDRQTHMIREPRPPSSGQ